MNQSDLTLRSETVKIEIVVGNIVKQPDMEAVVNSANANLRLGSGVAGAIHMAAGPELEKYCKPHAPLAYGSFLVTPGFELPNFWVIHVRAASYEMNDAAPKLLEQAIEAAFRGAHQNDIRSLAIPAIGTGVFAFPPELAAEITVKVLSRVGDLSPHLRCVRMCVTNDFLRAVYVAALQAKGLSVSQAVSSPE